MTQPFLLGAYPGGDLEKFETEINHKLAIHKQYNKFETFPYSASLSKDFLDGRIPLVMWSSDSIYGGSVTAIDILAGKYDNQFKTQAQAVAALSGVIILEWQPEMTDNPRNPLFLAGLTEDQYGAFYVAVWLHIQGIFDAVGVTNVQWIWSPGNRAFLPHHKNNHIPAQAYFPGAPNIDWIGLHCYEVAPENYENDPRIQAWYMWAQVWAPDVPMIQSETGAAMNIQSQWIMTAQNALKTIYPLVRGFVYFDAMNWTLTGPGLAEFKTMANDPYFGAP